jgi:8-oxo-dGTP diphosphatase
MVKAKYKDHWTFPSGIVDPGESPKAAVIRETDEEVGVHVEDIDCRFLTVIYTAAHGGDRDRFNFVFVVDTFDDSMSLSVPNEEIELAQWVDFSEVAQRAGKRRSYVAIQRMLLEPDEMKPYVEV